MTPTDPRLPTALRRATAFFALTIALAAAAVRLPKLDVFLTPDETRWACRSTNFYHALATGDLASTYQKEHPGVVTMWLGGLGQPIDDDADWRIACRDINPSDLVSDAPRPALDEITARLFRGRLRIALFISLAIGLMVWLLGRLFDHRVALVAGLIVALDPFYVAHSRVLHLDGVTTTLMTLSLLWLLLWLHRGRRKRDLLLSGVMAGLAAVNKSPALFMAPVAGLLIAADALAVRRPRTVREALGLLGPLARDVVVPVALWGAAATAAYVAVWPAMWVHPIASLRAVLGGAESYADQGHEGGNYFWGRPVVDPGPAFYPVAWALRTTPVAMVGLVLAGWFGMKRRHVRPSGDPAGASGRSEARAGARHAVPSPAAERLPAVPSRTARPVLLALVAFALLFALIMTGGAKKFDRYLLPIFPALNIVAGWGIATALVAWGERGMRRKQADDRDDTGASTASTASETSASSSSVDATMAAIQAEGAIAFGALVVAWSLAFTLYAHRPYFLDAYNPLVGGARAGEFALLLGWGEGLDQAAAYLNAQPSPETLQLATRYRSVIGPQFKGLAHGMDDIDPAVTDYFVFYRNQLQRILDPELIGRYFGPEARPDHAPTPVVAPDLTMKVGDLMYGWVFANRNWEPAAHFIDDRADPKRDAILVRAGSVFARGYSGPLVVVEVDPNATDETVDALLEASFITYERLWWVRYIDVVPYRALRRVDDALAVNAYRTADSVYDELRVSRFDRAPEVQTDTAGPSVVEPLASGGAPAGVDPTAGVSATSGVSATMQISTTVALTEPIGYFDRDPADPAVGVALVGIDVPARAAEPGRGLPITLRWQRPAAVDADLVGFFHLVPAADVRVIGARRIAQDDRPLLDAAGRPTSQWPLNETEFDRRVVSIPAGTVPGRYALLIGVYDGRTTRRLDAAPRPAGDRTSLKDVQRLTDGVFAFPIEVGPATVAFDDSALGLTHGHIDAALTDDVALWGFDVARPVEAGNAAAVTAVWSVPTGASTSTTATVGTSATLPAFVHIRITDTLGANVSDMTAPIVALPIDRWQPGDRLRADHYAPIYGRAMAGEGFIRFTLLDADQRPLRGRGPDGWASLTAPFTIDGPLRFYDLPPDVPSDTQRDVTFGDLAKLRAAEVAITRVDTGAPVTVTLWWEALTQADTEQLFWIGFMNGDGDVVSAQGFAPADGRRRITSWIGGEVIRDRHILVADVQDAGRYDIVVRLTATDGSDAPVTATGDGATGSDGWVKVGRVTVR
ncbi:MAG: glycosyltransferase family 39 protein [Ardenticatenales bacterium]|nr:glycosyltransferase family 39 protein [Ardenticatenales bacterium]